MITLGRFHTLTITELSGEGAYLDGKNLGEVFLPLNEIEEQDSAGSQISVFVYLDSDGLTTATKKTPNAQLGDFALMRVKEINSIGAFLDWGIDKDLLVPYGEQNPKMEQGMSYLVGVYLDNASERLCASNRYNKFVGKAEANYNFKDKVDLIVAGRTDLGYKVIVDKLHWGIVYYDTAFKSLFVGQTMPGYIKKVREDNKLDIVLEPIGMAKVHTLADKIVEELNKNNGFLPLGDKSDPELIKKTFSCSKANFKKAIGGLFKKGIIAIEAKSIKLN